MWPGINESNRKKTDVTGFRRRVIDIRRKTCEFKREEATGGIFRSRPIVGDARPKSRFHTCRQWCQCSNFIDIIRQGPMAIWRKTSIFRSICPDWSDRLLYRRRSEDFIRQFDERKQQQKLRRPKRIFLALSKTLRGKQHLVSRPR